MLVCSHLAPAADLPPAVPVAGKPFHGDLINATANWQLAFRAGGTTKELPADELVSWGTPVETARGPVVVLADGGLLVADVLGADKEQLSVDSAFFGTLKIPLELLAGVVFQLPAGRQERDALVDRVAAAKGDADRLLLDNGDEVTGQIDALVDDTVKLKAGVGPLEIKTDRIAAMVFNPALRSTSKSTGLRAWTGFSDGSRLLAVQLAVDEKTASITMAGRQTWKTATKELAALEPMGGRATYLSDLKPAEYRHTPYLDMAWPYRLDRSVTGGLLRSGGRLAWKGLGVHSAARLVYTLEGGYRRFQADAGIDDATGGRGSVIFRVLVDGREKFASPIVRGGDPPVPISVDISGGKRLELSVDYADRGDELDHADWLAARLVK